MTPFTSPQLLLTAFLPLSLCADLDTVDTDSPVGLVDSFGDTAAPELGPPLIEDVQADQHEQIGSIVVVSWEQLEPATAWVEYSFDDDIWQQSPARAVEDGSAQVLLLGIPYGMELDYRVVNDLGDGPMLGELRSASTAELPEALAHAELLTADPGAYERSASWFLGSVNSFETGVSWTVILDRQGRVVWSWEIDGLWYSQMPRPSQDGTALMMDYNSYWRQFDEGADARVRRYRIDGTLVKEVATPGMFQSWTELPDGSIVYGSGQPVETLMEIAPDGTTREIWDCQEFLELAGLEGRGCHSNYVHHNPVTDTIIISCITHETVLEVERSSGELLRWFGKVKSDWSFDPPESQFFWQHGVHVLSDGTLMVSTKNEDDGHETLVRQYRMDAEKQELRQVWSFGEDQGVYAECGGGAHRFDGGNTLHHYGYTPRIREVTAEGEVVWDVQWEGEDIRMGYILPLEDLYAFAP
jgi:hypothetical protein